MMRDDISRRSLLAASLAGAVGAALPAKLMAAEPQYHILRTPAGREVAYWAWRAVGKKRGTILFSHGAASSPRHYTRMLGPWSEQGYDVLAPLHVDSSEHPRTAEFAGLASWTARIEDMRLLADSLGGKDFIAAGHSYGGLTAIALGGGVSLVPADVAGPLRHSGALAVLAFSPPAALPPLVGPTGYAPLAVPSFHQTGTGDILSSAQKPEEWIGHLDAYQAALEEKRHYALVLPEVDHYFGGLICNPKAAGPPMPSELDHAVALSSQFLDAFIHQSASAKRRFQAQVQTASVIGLRHK
jgi:pimeloyl-ACP methyl ester carboxylesterase